MLDDVFAVAAEGNMTVRVSLRMELPVQFAKSLTKLGENAGHPAMKVELPFAALAE